MPLQKIILTILLSTSLAVDATYAQENDYIYKDTSSLFADSVTDAEQDYADEEMLDEEDGNETDTILTFNALNLNPDSIAAIKRMKSFNYAKNLDSLLYKYQQAQLKKKPANIEPSFLQLFFAARITFYIFCLLGAFFVGFIIYKLFFTQGFFQRASLKSQVNELKTEPGLLASDADYSTLIAQAIEKQHYRLATRYHYLQVLQKLSSKGVITLARDKTNHEYLTELSGKTYKKQFAEITLLYEYAWYGEFEINNQGFETIQQKFKLFNTSIQ